MKKYIANLSRCADCYVFCYPNAGLPNAMGGYDQKGPEMAEEIRPFCEDGIVNAIGGCCGTSPEHIAAIRAMASAYPPRKKHGVEDLMRLSGLEPLNYKPNEADMRSTFLMIGERCNVAGSIIYKKAIVEGNWDKACQIALQQVGGARGKRQDGFAQGCCYWLLCCGHALNTELLPPQGSQPVFKCCTGLGSWLPC